MTVEVKASAYFNIVAQTTENTVVTEYEPVRTRSDASRVRPRWSGR